MSQRYRICVRCIMDTSDLGITFNAEGKCNHCISAESLLERYHRIRIERPNALHDKLDEVRRNPGKEGFHALIGISGGLDSSYLLHLMSQWDLKLLAVHVDAGWNSIASVKNINSLVSGLGIEMETVVMDWNEVKDLQIAFLKSGVINQDVPQDHAFFGSLFRLAKKYSIKYVLSGSNYATESILPKSWGQNAMDGKQIRTIHTKFGQGSLASYPITHLSDLYFQSYLRKRYQVIAPLNLIDYSQQRALQVLEKEYNWVDYGGKHKESKFTEYFQEIYLPSRFGIQKKRAHLSSLIVSGEMTRNAALIELETSAMDQLYCTRLEQFVATKLGMPVPELRQYCHMPFIDDETFGNQKYLTKLVEAAVSTRDLVTRINIRRNVD